MITTQNNTLFFIFYNVSIFDNLTLHLLKSRHAIEHKLKMARLHVYQVIYEAIRQ